MNQITNFFSETYNELMHKVSWPTWEELQASTVVVTVAAIIVAFIVFVMDKAADLAMSTFYHLF
ncbi:MAG TPA: preprotein translocase subunit SecE [Chitinophagales bacterium]|nr:preprotein translocase subunit SecE [Chitinophagales bacterium]